MYRKTLLIDPFEYRHEELDAVMGCAEALKDSFDTYVIVDTVPPETGKAENISFVEASSRQKVYLDTVADCILDAGAANGSGRLSSSQKRICLDNDKLREKYAEETLASTDYFSGMDMKADIAAVCSNAKELLEQAGLSAGERRYSDIIFLMEYLEQDDDEHREVLQLAGAFKKAFGSRMIAAGLKEIGQIDPGKGFFDADGMLDLKLSTENNPGTVRCILRETQGIIIVCSEAARYGYRNFIKGKKTVLMYEGGGRHAADRRHLTGEERTDTDKWKEIFDRLNGDGGFVSVEKKGTALSGALRRIKRKLSGDRSEKAASHSGKAAGELPGKRTSPLVSVVMPFYNNKETVADAVSSVIENGYDNTELILVNDGSDEDPMETLDENGKIRYYCKENGGPGSARNLGIDEARGEYILFLDSDDTAYPGAIKKLVDYAAANGLDMVSGKTIRHHAESGREEEWCGNLYTKEMINPFSERVLLLDDTISTAKLYRAKALRESGVRFGDGLFEDNVFISRIYATLGTTGIIPDPVQKWMVYGDGTSRSMSNTFGHARERLQKADLIYNESDARFRVYYTRQYIRHQMIAAVNGYNAFSDDEKRQMFELMKEGLELRKESIIDRLILMPAKKRLYKSVLADDRESFDRTAAAFSANYFSRVGS